MPQSALVAAGRDAERILHLFVVMAAGAAVIWIVVAAIAVYAIRRRGEPHSERTMTLFIVGGGVTLPTVVLGGLLAYTLPVIPELLAPSTDNSLTIDVSAKQWWWRVRYRTDAGIVETANELRLPLGQRVNVSLSSADVIHSFWVPSLAGKVDMIPGRRTQLALEPTRTGVFRGACAEYCGSSHALMAFEVIVTERDEFDDWLAGQMRPAIAQTDPIAQRGEREFAANGCGACHTVRGSEADGRVGPDLTHVGSRLGIGASTLRSDRQSFLRWIAHADALKPGVHMPAFRGLTSESLSALAAYLDNLR